jgi:hypothetical protein
MKTNLPLQERKTLMLSRLAKLAAELDQTEKPLLHAKTALKEGGRKRNPISQARALELFEYRDGRLFSRRSQQFVGHLTTPRAGKILCMKVRMDGGSFSVHRVIWVMHNGPIPDHLEIDHKNRDATDNRIENLRIATNRLNKGNRVGRMGSNQLPHGVHKNRKGYQALTAFKGVSLRVSGFQSPDRAFLFFQRMSVTLYGEYSPYYPLPKYSNEQLFDNDLIARIAKCPFCRITKLPIPQLREHLLSGQCAQFTQSET